MYPAQIVIEALNKAGSVQALAQKVGVTDQTVRNWLNFTSCPTDARLKQLVAVSCGVTHMVSSWEERQKHIEEAERNKVVVPMPIIQKPINAEPSPPMMKKAWKQLVEITRIHEKADYAFGVTDDALITFIVPHVADKLKEAGIRNGDEVTLVVRENEHPNADLYAFKWVEDDYVD